MSNDRTIIDNGQLIDPELFVTRMEARWTSLGNSSSEPLRSLWRTMAIALNPRADEPLLVLPPPTGSGKTVGLTVYAALLIERNMAHPTDPVGMLIVARTIEQADADIVAAIRTLLPAPVNALRVVAKHSGNTVTLQELHSADVAVISHEAYRRALEGLGSRLNAYTQWQHGSRKLTVIDEAMAGLVSTETLTAEDIKTVRYYLPESVIEVYPDQLQALDVVAEALSRLDKEIAGRGDKHPASRRFSPVVVWRSIYDGLLRFPERYAMSALRQTLSSVRFDTMHGEQPDTLRHKRIAEKVDDTLRAVEAILSQWAFYFSGKSGSLNTGRFLAAEGFNGHVVMLDATATQNSVVMHMGPRARIVPVPQGARDYSNVMLRVLRDAVGKHSMIQHGRERIARVLADIEARAPGSNVLLVSHREVRPLAEAYSPAALARFEVNHWGNVDGKNDWSDFDTVILLGLLYRPKTWAAAMFFALKGLPPRGAVSPSWKGYAAAVKDIERRALVTDVTQAANRVRCRRTIDAEGRCAPTNVFLTLPKGSDGDFILAELQREMPGIVVQEWELELDAPGSRPEVRRNSAKEQLLAVVDAHPGGEIDWATEVKKGLGLKRSTEEDLRAAIKDPGSDIAQALARRNTVFIPGSSGRYGLKPHLIKRAA